MSRIWKGAIDSRPLSADAFGTYDYSGLQLHGLTTTPLSFFLGKSRLGSDGLCTLIPIAPSQVWSDGEPITASQYLEGIRRVLGGNPFFKRFLFRKVKSLRVVGNALEVSLHRPNFRLLDVFSIPNFVPYRAEPGVFSGDYVVEKWEADRYQFIGREGNRLEVHVVKDPERNLELFSKGDLDFTADTAFPYYRFNEYREEVRQAEVGLTAALTFGDRLKGGDALPIRRFVQRGAMACNFSGVTFGLCPDLRTESAGPVKASDLRLAYDDYYPNREICEVLVRELERQGSRVQLVKDDYYTPAAEYDVKFVIQRSLGGLPYLKFAGELFGKVLSASPQVRNQYAALLESWESTSQLGAVDSIVKRLACTLRESVASVPLFSIPSQYLSRLDGGENPLTAKVGVA